MQLNAGTGRAVDRRLFLGEAWKRPWSVGFSQKRQEGLFMRDQAPEESSFRKGVQALRCH